MCAGNLDCVFDRLGAGVYQKSFLRELSGRDCVQALGETNVIFVGRDLGAGVQKILELRLEFCDDVRIAVPGVEAADTSRKIDKAVAVHVFEPGILGVRDVDRRGVRKSSWNGAFAARGEGTRLGAGNRSFELNSSHFLKPKNINHEGHPSTSLSAGSGTRSKSGSCSVYRAKARSYALLRRRGHKWPLFHRRSCRRALLSAGMMRHKPCPSHPCSLASTPSTATGNRQLITGNCFSVPADRLLVQVDVYLLGLEILFDSPGTELATESGLLVTSPRRFNVCRLHVIDPDNPGAQ